LKAIKELYRGATLGKKASLVEILLWASKEEIPGIRGDIQSFFLPLLVQSPEQLVEWLSQRSLLRQIKLYRLIRRTNKVLARDTWQLLIRDERIRDLWRRDIKSLTATAIHLALYLLSLDKEFLATLIDSISISDWKQIIESSTLNGVRLLFLSFAHLGLIDPPIKLTQALLQSDLPSLIRKEESLYRIIALLNFVIEVDGLESGLIKEHICTKYEGKEFKSKFNLLLWKLVGSHRFREKSLKTSQLIENSLKLILILCYSQKISKQKPMEKPKPIQ